MGKYIIEVGDAHVRHALGRKLIIPVIINNNTEYWVNTNIQLTPYTEPDTDEAYRRGYETAKHECEDCRKIRADAEQELADKAYQSGLSDAWETVKELFGFIFDEQATIFKTTSVRDIVRKYSASEAIEKIRAYEQKKQESITTEDVMRQYLDTFCMHNKGCAKCPLNTPDFTCGRGYHFLTTSPVSDEEVRRAYATVIAK